MDMDFEKVGQLLDIAKKAVDHGMQNIAAVANQHLGDIEGEAQKHMIEARNKIATEKAELEAKARADAEKFREEQKPLGLVSADNAAAQRSATVAPGDTGSIQRAEADKENARLGGKTEPEVVTGDETADQTTTIRR